MRIEHVYTHEMNVHAYIAGMHERSVAICLQIVSLGIGYVIHIQGLVNRQSVDKSIVGFLGKVLVCRSPHQRVLHQTICHTLSAPRSSLASHHKNAHAAGKCTPTIPSKRSKSHPPPSPFRPPLLSPPLPPANLIRDMPIVPDKALRQRSAGLLEFFIEGSPHL